MKKTHLYLLALGLTVVGLGIFLYKVLVLEFPLLPETHANVWNVEARITFVALNKPVKVSLHIPRNSKRFAIMDESFISRGYGLTTVLENKFGNRQALWSVLGVTD